MDNYTHSPQKPLRAFVDESTEDVYEIEVDPVDDAIEALLSDVEAELEFDSFDENTLFDHFIVTLHRLFSIVRYQYGKSLKDLSPNDIDDFVTLYWCKFNSMLSSPYAHIILKYDYDSFYKEFSCLPRINIRISIRDYILLTTKKNSIDEVGEDKVNRFIRVYRKYLPEFFGIRYNHNSSKEWKHEVIRLVKILYDCSEENKDISFLCIQHPSLVKFNPLLDTTYTNTVKYIKRKVILRSCYENNISYLKNIIYMEKYADALQSFLNSISYEPINHITKAIGGHISCKIKRSICKKVYQTILKNIETITPSNIAYNHLDDPSAIPNYAYMYFLLSRVKEQFTPMESKKTGVSKEYYPYATPTFYENTALFSRELIETEEDISWYIQGKKTEIIKLVYKKNPTKEEKKKYSRYMKRHIEKYKFLYAFFKDFMNNNQTPLCGKDIVYIIKFYETLAQDGVSIPLRSGYTKTPHSSLKISCLLKKMASIKHETNRALLSDESYLIASLWLQDRMTAFWDMRTDSIQTTMHQVQSAILDVWESYFPYLIDKDARQPSLNEFVAQILPKSDLQGIIRQVSNAK